MNYTPHPITKHRLARLIAWAGAMLAWIGVMLFAPAPPRARRRHIRCRYGLLSLDAMARMVRNLIICRMHRARRPRRRANPPWRDFAPAGFVRRTRPRQLVRAFAGADLRRRLRHRDPRGRLGLLIAALADIDAFAARLARRRLTRIFGLRLTHAIAEPIAALSMQAPALADTS